MAKKYASATERFLGETFGPELLSLHGRISILVLYFVLCMASIYGVMKVEIDFKIEYFIDEDTYAYQYITL